MTRFGSAAHLVVGISLSLGGCITGASNPAATQPSTIQTLATTQPDYWYAQPGEVVDGPDFQRLWDASEEIAKDYLFKIDRRDYRAGVMTTRPMVSAQWFEPWRRELQSSGDVEESSLATVRRTIRFDFTRHEDGSFSVTPRVLVERLSQTEARITSVTRYRYAFGRSSSVLKEQPSGSREADRGIDLPTRYWYPVDRDLEFEKVVARDIGNRQGAMKATVQ